MVQVLAYRGSGTDLYGKEGDGNDSVFLIELAQLRLNTKEA